MFYVLDLGLGLGFPISGAALVMLEVAQGGCGVSPGALQKIPLLSRIFCPLRDLFIHEGHVVASVSGTITVAGLLVILNGLLVMLASLVQLPDFVV